ncbi:tryptophan 7-halogenase [Gilvimarinus sp. SDUM040013]|uniref:Tryptophan halogenase family protein n=1 Tax=Gilvimarinus gilvus TaxID=3058038 RepID=A0ABU4S3N1_9GAMM|nr:tryptophan halogenase family protein [Gilvimarinus sp. SDUM040013]MDO3384416.1 tryptophan 7-halogenase [Gilvimarinus sp. SDUM040013]MDX6851021.1 tryptophan halogenase family protein [Gilvimarinus sp. SDUM040013]
MSEKIKIVIVGGGTAGWMTAAALSSIATDKVCEVTLVESDQIATVGVGEATIPAIKEFNDRLGIIESEMMQKTAATFKLGIEFVDWSRLGSSYIHPFGTYGETYKGVDFHQLWQRDQAAGGQLPLERYSYAIQAARANRFEFPATADSVSSTYSYAYHFDAGLYANFLKEFAVARKATRVEGKVIKINRAENGNVSSIELENGKELAGDYFIDCSGFRSLLLGEELGVEFESWKKWLACDRALAVQSEGIDDIPPYTRATAKSAGWQWRIPLQHRVGNGLVYAGDFISDAKATDEIMQSVESPLSDLKQIKFEAGRRRASWVKNCIGIGLSSGFLEPLESTSIYLIQVAIVNFLKLLHGKVADKSVVREFNRLVDLEYDRVRDFLILHYKLTERSDSEFWQYCRNMEVPDSLQEKIELYTKRGYIDQYRYGLFSPSSWLAVLSGQGGVPKCAEPMAEKINLSEAQAKMRELQSSIEGKVAQMSSHHHFLHGYCPYNS